MREHPEIFESPHATLDNVLAGQAPVCIFERPGSGKSWTLKKLAQESSQRGFSLVIVDPANERLGEYEIERSTLQIGISENDYNFCT